MNVLLCITLDIKSNNYYTFFLVYFLQTSVNFSTAAKNLTHTILAYAIDVCMPVYLWKYQINPHFFFRCNERLKLLRRPNGHRFSKYFFRQEPGSQRDGCMWSTSLCYPLAIVSFILFFNILVQSSLKWNIVCQQIQITLTADSKTRHWNKLRWN